MDSRTSVGCVLNLNLFTYLLSWTINSFYTKPPAVKVVKNLKYSSVLNNRAANLILFWKKSILHALIPSCTFINFWIFLAKTFFYTNEKWKSPSCTALFHPARLLTFGILPSCTFIPSCTIIKDTRVLLFAWFFVVLCILVFEIYLFRGVFPKFATGQCNVDKNQYLFSFLTRFVTYKWFSVILDLQNTSQSIFIKF